jgi:hypothetical protein
MLLGWAAVGLAWPAIAHSQTDARAARAARVEIAPVLDGRVDDEAWTRTEPIEDFRQRNPVQGAAASELTSVRLLYDEEHLYIGARLSDTAPQSILATELRRDDSLESDDTFAVLLDTFHDRRNAFVFRVNPNGTRYDAVVRNEEGTDPDWDEQWSAAATRSPDGWSVEIAIPFKTLRFDRDHAQVWGLNFERVIKRKNEEVYWTNWNRSFEFTHVSQAGTLHGLEGIRQGQRLRIRPYLVLGGESLRAVSPGEPARALADAGIDDLKFAVTSNLTADIAVNPDFAQTEIDEQRVNLTRFSLFFPEKRQFFLEGAESLRMGPPLAEFSNESLELFHSRRIGLSNEGAPIPLVLGAKLTGKVRDVDLGVLGARTGEEDGIPGETFGVVRFRREMLSRSYVGAIATARDGPGHASTVLGADARFVLKRHLALSALAARADDGSSGPQWARHLGAEWDDDFLALRAVHLGIDRLFRPTLGFVRRRDRQTEFAFSVGPRPGGAFRQIEFGPELVLNHDEEGVLHSREIEVEVEADFESGDDLEISIGRVRENLIEPFEIEEGIELPAREYDWSQFNASFRSFDGRRLSANFDVEIGGFYSGRRRSLGISSDLRIGRHVIVQPEYELNDVDLAEGAFRTHLGGVRWDVAFSRDLLTSAFVQYTSEGHLAAIQVRLNYIFRNIDNFYVVYNETRFTAGPFADRSDRSLVMKVTYSLHR